MFMQLPAPRPTWCWQVTESISGEQRGAFERRNEKAACQMRLVMLVGETSPNLLGISIKAAASASGMPLNSREL